MKKYIIESKTHGTKEVLLDEEDYDLVDGIKWTALKDSKKENKFYIKRNINFRYVIDPRTGKRKSKRDMQFLHREIVKRMLNLQDKDLKGLHVDHVNGNPLDNRRENLRLATPQQNQWNRGPQTNNTSGYKGVTWNKHEQKWLAKIGKKSIYLGHYKSKEEAARAYDRWVIVNCDEHAYTNFPREDYI